MLHCSRLQKNETKTTKLQRKQEFDFFSWAGEVQVAFVFAAVVSVEKEKSRCRRNHKSSRRINKQARKKDVKTEQKREND